MVTAEEAKNMRSGVNIEGKVERKEEPRTVNTKSGGTIDVCNAYLVDESGEIKLTLWADDIPKINDGDLRLLIFILAILIPACVSRSPAFCMMYSAYKLNKLPLWLSL